MVFALRAAAPATAVFFDQTFSFRSCAARNVHFAFVGTGVLGRVERYRLRRDGCGGIGRESDGDQLRHQRLTRRVERRLRQLRNPAAFSRRLRRDRRGGGFQETGPARIESPGESAGAAEPGAGSRSCVGGDLGHSAGPAASIGGLVARHRRQREACEPVAAQRPQLHPVGSPEPRSDRSGVRRIGNNHERHQAGRPSSRHGDFLEWKSRRLEQLPVRRG
ncbi:MAG: hypothetical protein JWN34_5190 [Bryobacterales bacterium]|nr:hypothetical protein [Bryobacterales bacterium]